MNELTGSATRARECADLACLSNEALCRAAQQGSALERDLLWQRCRTDVESTMCRENQRHHLPTRELADARQHLYLAFDRAVLRYDPHPDGDGRRASFTTFLHVVVAHAFSNYCAGWRTYRRHISIRSLEEDDEPADDFRTATPDFPPATDDKASDRPDVPDRLAAAFRHLVPREQLLLWMWLQTGSDQNVAVQLGITVEAARLRRERLIRRLRGIISQP